MDQEIVMLSEVRQIACDNTHMWSLNNRYKWTELQDGNGITGVEKNLWLLRDGGGGINWETKAGTPTLLSKKEN